MKDRSSKRAILQAGRSMAFLFSTLIQKMNHWAKMNGSKQPSCSKNESMQFPLKRKQENTWREFVKGEEECVQQSRRIITTKSDIEPILCYDGGQDQKIPCNRKGGETHESRSNHIKGTDTRGNIPHSYCHRHSH